MTLERENLIDDRADGVDPQALLAVRDLRVHTAGGRTLISGVNLDVAAGESVAIVGESGSGKSITARSIIGLEPEGLIVSGSIRYKGDELIGMRENRRARLRGAEITMVLQDPFTMLHPMRRCGDIITETLRNDQGRRLSRAARASEAARRLAEVGITDGRVARRYPFELSGGMRQRVAIAAALVRNPQLLIADEPSTALDVTTQREVLNLLRDLQQARGMALILITHDLRVGFSVCHRVNVFYAGSIVEIGTAAEVAAAPTHPYSLGLLMAEPPVDRRVGELLSIPGSVPAPDSVRMQCVFAARCSWVADECLIAKPKLEVLPGGRQTACVRHLSIAGDLANTKISHERSAVEIPEEHIENAILRTSGLKVFYSSRRGEVRALDGVDIEVREGESVGIVGESGSGKTTLGRCLVGLVRPTDGTMAVNGIDATSYESTSRSDRSQLRRSIQIVFQDPYSSLNPRHSIGAALNEALSVRLGRRAKRAEVSELLRQVNLSESYAARRPASLSGGERQRVAIARALAVEPKILICDEAVSALDVSVQAQILTLLRTIRKERNLALMFITHDLAVVRQIADRIYVMHNGIVVESGPTAQVMDAPSHAYTRRLIQSIPVGDEASTGVSAV